MLFWPRSAPNDWLPLSDGIRHRNSEREYLVISNIETAFLPSNTASSFSSARMLRLSLGSWSSCLRTYSQSFLVSSVRGSGSLPTTAASAASGCTGLLRAFLGAAAFFGVGIEQL